MILALLASSALASAVPPLAFTGDPRPVLSGPEQTRDSDDGFFRMHYTTEGADRPTGADANGDGVPDTVTRTLDRLVGARQEYAQQGWRALVGDEGGAGSDALDVYLHQVDINGYTHGVPISGETGRGSCWIEIDNTLGDTGNILESVVTHELNHCQQYRYTWESDPWIYEAEATYEQYRWDSSGALLVGLAYLWQSRLEHPEWAIDDLTGRFDYAGLGFVKFWQEYGGHDDHRQIALWEALQTDPHWQSAFDTAAQDAWGLSFSDAFLQYATWNAFACGRDDGQHWEDDGTACTSSYEPPMTPAEAGTPFAVDLPNTPFSAQYVEVAAGGSGDAVQVDCDPPGAGAALGVNLVALDAAGTGGEAKQGFAQDDQGVSVRLDGGLDPDGKALVVLASIGTAAPDGTCTATWVTAVPVDTGGGDTGGGPAACACATGTAPAAGLPWLLSLLALVGLRRRDRA